MRTTPPTNDEIDAWMSVLRAHGHLYRAEHSLVGVWTVRRTPTGMPRTLHHPVLALDFITEVLREVRPVTANSAR